MFENIMLYVQYIMFSSQNKSFNIKIQLLYFINFSLHSSKNVEDRENTLSQGRIIKFFWNWTGESLFILT